MSIDLNRTRELGEIVAGAVLVTALHARAVQGLGEGRAPGLGPLLATAARLSPIVAGLVGGVLTLVVDAVGPPVLYVIASVLLRALALSISALGGTLLFFDLRVRAGQPA